MPIRHRVAGFDGDPVRAIHADRDGLFAWRLPISDGTTVQVRIPGAELARMRDDPSAAAPYLYAGDNPWSWDAGVGSVANEGMKLQRWHVIPSSPEQPWSDRHPQWNKHIAVRPAQWHSHNENADPGDD